METFDGDVATRDDALIGPDWLEAHLDDDTVRIVEVDVNATAYGEGHIPGAVLWDIYTDLKDADYRLVDDDAFARLVARSGIDRDTVVVFYGYGPAIGFWALERFGHPHVVMLDATRASWRQGDRPWTTATPEPAVRSVTRPLPRPDERLRASRADVEQAIGDPEVVVLDVRSEAEYRGERFWPSGAPEPGGRAGHVPGAVHLPCDALYGPDGTFRPANELATVVEPLGLRDDTAVITYCTIGGRACAAWFVLSHVLGHERTRVYDGSWAEWGRETTAPVER